MTNNNKKRISATVSEEFYKLIEQIASRRYIHRKGYMTQFIILALKILIKVNSNPKLLVRINKVANREYSYKNNYEDRISQLVYDALCEYLQYHENN